MTHHVGFSGSSRGMSVNQEGAVRNMLRRLRKQGHVIFHHGDCVGADEEAHELAWRLHCDIVIHPPTDPKARAWCPSQTVREPLPYLERNKAIVRESGLLLATPASRTEVLRSGTWATIRYARKAGLDVHIYF